MNLRMTKQAQKFMAGLDAKQFRQVGLAVFSLMGKEEPHDSQALHGAKRGERRLDAGEYRIVYTREDDLASVSVIGKRNDGEVYRFWEQLG